ncbi:MAG: cytochrome C [Phycisphaerae bacterium]|nr:cytochrome C [Phycisphaerae bacterium]
MASVLDRIVGPRVPVEEWRGRPGRYALPTLALSAARVLLIVSLFLPYWHMTLEAPQYPDGLSVTAFVNHLTGDVKEIDGLNHYIGMRPLHEAAQFERTASVWVIIAMVLLVEGAAAVHSKWAVVLVLPAVLFPVGFVADLYYWLSNFGQNLDPKAPLSSSVKPFTPTIFGPGGIGQFKTYSWAGLGLWFACGSSVLAVVSLVFHRRAYKALFDRAMAQEASCAS